MSTSNEEQVINLTTQQVLVLRGAMHVAEEVLEQPEIEVARRFPITEGQLPTIRRLRRRLNRRVEDADVVDGERIQEVLDPAEAQAVRDVAGLLEFLLQDAAGREHLVDIGWLPRPDTPVDEAEVDALMTVLEMVDPTGVRPERTEPQREGGETIDPTLSLEGVLANAEDELANAEIPWAGFEQTKFKLVDTTDSFSGGETTLSCETILKNLVVVTKLAVAGTRHMSTAPGREWVGEFPVWADEAYTAVMSAVETKHCVNRDAQATLWDHIDPVVNSLTPGATNAVTENALELVRVMQNMTVSGAIKADYPPESDEQILEHITRLREQLDVIAPVTTEEELNRAIRSLTPSTLADCGLLLDALAELAQLAYQVEIARDDVPLRRFNAMKQTVAHNRRLILNKMGFDREVVDDPIPGSQLECLDDDQFVDLRDSFMLILNPSETEARTASEDRAYAALSDIRNTFLDPRHGP